MTVASREDRAAAWIIDTVIAWGSLILVFGVVIFAVEGESSSEPGQTGVGFLGLLIVPLYSALLHRFWRGQTIGKRLVGIAVVRTDGTPIGLGQSLGRSYLRSAFLLALWLPWIADSLWPLWGHDHRSLHDLIAGTVVIQP